jgi:preprotein translocase subunit YajC
VKSLLPLILIALAFVVLIVLPARMRSREMQRVQQVQGSLTHGVEVMTSSGMYGRVVHIGADSVDLEIAPGVVTTWAKMAIREVRAAPADPAGPDSGGDPSRPPGAEPE